MSVKSKMNSGPSEILLEEQAFDTMVRMPCETTAYYINMLAFKSQLCC